MWKGWLIGFLVFIVLGIIYMTYYNNNSSKRANADFGETCSVASDGSHTSDSSGISKDSISAFDLYKSIRSFMGKQAAYIKV